MICPICEKEFIIKNKQGGQNRKFCYDCLPENLSKSEQVNLKRKLLLEKANTEKINRGCDICGYNKCPTALEWHHNNDNKLFNPSDRLRDGSLLAYLNYKEEIKKCSLLCSNCHREIHEGITSFINE